MAITKIWNHKRLDKRNTLQGDVRKSISDGIYYVENPEKVTIQSMTNIIKSEPDGTSAKVYESLLKGVNYAVNAEKTTLRNELEDCFCQDDECKFVTGINCSSGQNAIDEFVQVKEQWDDLEPEITHFHGVQSFKGHECSPETAHEIGVELARRLWGDRFQVVVCTHLNTKNVHNHFIINATSFVDGKRFYDNNQSYYKMRYESDMFCKKYNLSVIDSKASRKKHGKAYHYYKLEKQGAPTRINIAKEALDIALQKAATLQELQDILYDMEYECDFSPNHKHWTIRSFGWGKPVRLYQIAKEYGDAYNKEGIIYRLDEDKDKSSLSAHPAHQACQVHPDKEKSGSPDFVPTGDEVRTDRLHADVSKQKWKKRRLFAFGIQGYYLHYLYLLGVLPKRKKRYSAKYAAMVSWRARDDVLNVHDILNESKILNRNHIHTESELAAYREKIQKDIQQITKDAIKKKMTPEELAVMKNDLKALRKEIVYCNHILYRSRKIYSKLKAPYPQNYEIEDYGNSNNDDYEYNTGNKINF